MISFLLETILATQPAVTKDAEQYRGSFIAHLIDTRKTKNMFVVGCSVFYGISNLMVYLMPNPNSFLIFIFTQHLRSGRIWHKVNFLSGV